MPTQHFDVNKKGVLLSVSYQYIENNQGQISLPNAIIKIGWYVFSNNQALKTVIISNSVRKISGNAFSRCYNLESISIPCSVIKIGEYAFCQCTKLKSITFPNSLKKIANNAFSGCTNLQSITLSDSIIEIGHNAFANCPNITEITIITNHPESENVKRIINSLPHTMRNKINFQPSNSPTPSPPPPNFFQNKDIHPFVNSQSSSTLRNIGN